VSSVTDAANSSEEDQSLLDRRWKGALSAGFVSVPRLLFTRQRDLGLDSGEVVLLMNLVGSWWADGQAPFPAISTLAYRMNVSERTIQRYIVSLEKKRYIKRVRGPGVGRAADLVVTRFQLDGLVQRLIEVDKTLAVTPRPKRARFNPFRAASTKEVLSAT
jgi:hypothetical protein